MRVAAFQAFYRVADPPVSPMCTSFSRFFAGTMHAGGWVVDPAARKVACKGTARFKWTEGIGEGQWWDEQFAYILDFDDEGKVTDYQVWADSGAAYLARLGQLKGLKEVRFAFACAVSGG